MDMQKQPQPSQSQPPQQPQQPRQSQPPWQPAPDEGCLVVAIRIPVRILAFLVVLPIRLLWDALAAVARFLWRYLLAPAGRAVGLLLRALLVVPLIWAYRHLLTPLGHALLWLHARVLTPLGRALVRLLTPVAQAVAAAVVWVAGKIAWLAGKLTVGLYWTARVLLVLPALALWRWILAPVARVLGIVLREIGEALGHAWRAAGYVARAAGRVLGTLFRWIFLEPARWAYRTVLTPVGHVVRDLVLRPAAQAARAIGRAVGQARADVRRALFGEPRRPAPVERREPRGRDTRTLDG
ncbi:hypothetical protein AB0D74_09405 [Streptomyces sp. NPDC048278]|uniref:hypothetical protein n=1 Tax=Streptomyces sp. NPDC048278 TaxID=3155809 RepID=UPI00342C1790